MEDEHGSALDTLETRLADIERRVYGRSNPSHRETEDAADGGGGGIVPRLTDISKEVGSTIGTRERLAPLLRRLTELDAYIDPSFGESKGLPADIKAEIILAQEEKIRKSSVTLKTIQEKSSVLNADALLAYTQPESNANIMKLSSVQLDQEAACSRLNEVAWN